jgi:hypothetical protein
VAVDRHLCTLKLVALPGEHCQMGLGWTHGACLSVPQGAVGSVGEGPVARLGQKVHLFLQAVWVKAQSDSDLDLGLSQTAPVGGGRWD